MVLLPWPEPLHSTRSCSQAYLTVVYYCSTQCLMPVGFFFAYRARTRSNVLMSAGFVYGM